MRKPSIELCVGKNKAGCQGRTTHTVKRWLFYFLWHAHHHPPLKYACQKKERKDWSGLPGNLLFLYFFWCSCCCPSGNANDKNWIFYYVCNNHNRIDVAGRQWLMWTSQCTSSSLILHSSCSSLIAQKTFSRSYYPPVNSFQFFPHHKSRAKRIHFIDFKNFND